MKTRGLFLTCALLLVFSIQISAEPLQGSIDLLPGLNLVGIPVDPTVVPDMAVLLHTLGTPDTLAQLLRLNPTTGRFESCAFDGTGNPIGDGCSASVVPGEGWLVEALTTTTLDFDTVLPCPSYILHPGANIVAFPCATDNLTATDLLQHLGDATVAASVQALNPVTGGWQTSAYHDAQAVGVNFHILSGRAYLVYMRQEIALAPPVADAGLDQTVVLLPDARVQLDGSNSSDADTPFDALTFQWTLQLPEGSEAVLDASNGPTPGFVPDLPGVYVGILTVSDGISQSMDAVDIVVIDPTEGTDADGDGLSDEAERALGTDPQQRDSDGDGLTDGEEVLTYGTDPLKKDSDGDGFEDGFEIAVGSDPLDKTSTPPPDTFSIAIGDVVSDGVPAPGAGHLETSGSQDVYIFTAAAGQTVYFDEQSGSCYSGIYWRLTDAEGNQIFDELLGLCGYLPDAGLFTLEGGTYTITVYGSGDATGTYQFQLWEVPPPDEFNIAIGDQVSDGVPGEGAGHIETPGVQDIYTFTAAAGQTVYFDEQSGNCYSGIYWRLTDADGNQIFEDRLQGLCSTDVGLFTLEGGTYTITVFGSGDATDTYQFQLWEVAPPQEFNIAIGDQVSDGVLGEGAGHIETPGVQDIYTFTAAAGQTVYFDEQSGSCNSGIYWRLTDADGNQIFEDRLQGLCTPDVGLFTLEGGTYTITVFGSSDATGTYQFQILEQ